MAHIPSPNSEGAFIFSSVMEWMKCWQTGTSSRLVLESFNGKAFFSFSGFLGAPQDKHFKTKSKKKQQRDNERAAAFQARQEAEAANKKPPDRESQDDLGQDPDPEVRIVPKSRGEKEKSSGCTEDKKTSDEEKDTELDPDTCVRKSSVSSSDSPYKFYKPQTHGQRVLEDLRRRKEQREREEEAQWEDVPTQRRPCGRTVSVSSLQYSASPARNGEQLVAAYKGKRKKKKKRKFY